MSPLSNLQADWPAINRLLDQALELPASERAAWLAALPADAEGLKHTVERLLAASGGVETGDFLHTLPKLQGADQPASQTDAQPGAEVGPWRLLREIGEGGMGSVWLAERADGSLKRQVALKLPRLSWQRGLAERMARERDILATLEHPHIARLYDAGVDALGRPWLALEYVHGRPLDEHARSLGLDVRQRVKLLLQVCDAVAYAHSRLVIHRDLKPSNILVTDDGQVKLLDFGIAKLMQGDVPVAGTALTELSGRALTPEYASPEQLRGEALTTASDVYSLGIVAFELLAGSRPYRLERGSAVELEALFADGPVKPASERAPPEFRPALRGDLDAVLGKALAASAVLRYSVVDALAADLRRHLSGEAVQARREGVIERLWRPVQRHRWPVGVAAAGALALLLAVGAGATVLVLTAAVAGSVVSVLQARRARVSSREAQAAARRAERVRDGLLRIFEPSPTRLDGRKPHEISLKEAVDGARDRASESMTADPADLTVVLAALASVYEQLDLADDNFALLNRALDLLERAAAPDPGVQQQKLHLLRLRLSAAFFHQRFDDFEPILERLDALLDTIGEPPGGARASALFFRVRFERMSGGDAAQAVDRLAVAESMYARHAPADPTRAHALALAVQAAMHAGRWKEAEDFARSAIELARRAPDSPEALGNAFSVRGVLRLRLERWALARQDLLAARTEYRRHVGEQDPLTAQNEVFLGHALIGCGELADGLATARAGAALISQLRRGQMKEAQTLERLGAAELLAGEVQAAVGTLQSARACWDAVPGCAPAVSAETTALLACAWARCGRLAEAVGALSALDALLGSLGTAASARLRKLREEAATVLGSTSSLTLSPAAQAAEKSNC